MVAKGRGSERNKEPRVALDAFDPNRITDTCISL
jgi:hypothetical protein